jgi:voltage-gated potassium channel Kch
MAMGGAGAGERSPGGRGGGLILFIFAPLARFAGVLVVVLLPLVLGYIGLHQYLSQPAAAAAYGHGWADTAFYDLQLPVLAAAPVEGAGPYPVPLGIARLLAPAVAGLATLGTLRLLLAEQRRRWSAATARRHAVVVGDGPVAIELARRLRAEMRKVVLVGSSDTTLTWARTNRLLGVRGEPADPSALRAAGIARARELYACTDLGTANAAIAVQARDEVPVGRKRPLAAYALVHDVELGVAFQARSIGAAGDPRLRLDFFNVADIAARKLLDEYPLAVTDGQRASVVIVGGSGQLGRAILREIARRHQPGSPRVEVVLRHAAADAVAAVTAAFPEISASCLVTTAAGAELPAAAQYTVFVCVDDDDDALREGLAMAPALGGQRGHVVVCLRESSPLGGVLGARSALADDVTEKLRVFGVIEEACVPASIRADFTERLARSIHSAYVAAETEKGQPPRANPSMAPWEQLPENLRESNIAQAADIGAKLALIHAVVIPETAAAPAFAFAPEEIERLAQLEHQRWMREKTAEGWRYGRSRDNAAKIHPDLQGWSSLSEESRDKDRNAIRTLPAILRAAGFLILRLPPP